MTAFNTILTRFSALVILSCSILSACSEYEFDYLYKDLPFEMAKVERPQIPAREVLLTDFGGVGDGVALNTEAFAKAIDALSQCGGGRLVVPTGVWLTGPIDRKSVV